MATASAAAAGDATNDNQNAAEEPWCAAAEKYTARVWKDIRKHFQEDQLTDVMLAADGQSIPCHRVILSAASKFFFDKFEVHPESVEHNLLVIDGIDFNTLKSAVYFVYNGRVELTLKKAEKLIPASVNLMLPELTNMCKEFLIHKVDNDKEACIDIHRIAKSNSLELAAGKAWDLMIANFQEVSQTNAFKEMSETDLQAYISDERLNVANENPVFEAVVLWVRHDVENRKGIFEKMMENVKLSHCSQQFLGEVVRTEELMQTVNCLRHLADAMYHHTISLQNSGTSRRGHERIIEAGSPTEELDLYIEPMLISPEEDDILLPPFPPRPYGFYSDKASKIVTNVPAGRRPRGHGWFVDPNVIPIREVAGEAATGLARGKGRETEIGREESVECRRRRKEREKKRDEREND